jgi:hypothetical protein
MRRCLLFAAAIAVLVVPNLRADVLPLNTWENFAWSDGGVLPAATTPTSWTFTTTTTTLLEITDAFNIGDEFSVSITGPITTSFNTSAINPALDGNIGPGIDGPSAWADTDYSRGSMLLGPGTYSVTVDIIKNAKGFTNGAGFIGDFTPSVPEPRGIAFLTIALAGLGFAAVRRSRKESRGAGLSE